MAALLTDFTLRLPRVCDKLLVGGVWERGRLARMRHRPAISEGFVAAVLLVAGGLNALRTASIAAGLPVSVVLLAMTFGVIKSLTEDSSAAP